MNRYMMAFAVLLVLTVDEATRAQEAESSAAPAVREQRNVGLSLAVSSIYSKSDDGFIPRPQLQFEYNLSPFVSVDAYLLTLVIFNTAHVGTRLFMFRDRFSPYFRVSAGWSGHPALSDDSRPKNFFSLLAGGGIDRRSTAV